ncbi:MAG: WD40 repeat domain-containing protein [Candidatus Acidiferrales bacterium]
MSRCAVPVNHHQKFMRLALTFAAILAALVSAPRLEAQLKPLASIELDCRAFAISSDGLTACVVFHQLGFKKTTIERDNIWTVTQDGKKRKEIVDGQRLVQTDIPFSFKIRGIAFSPSGDLMTLQMNIAELTDPQGSIQESKLVDLMNIQGKEIPVAGTKTSVIENAVQATWLADDETVVYLLPSDEDDLLYKIGLTHPHQGKGNAIFAGHLFTAVAWDPVHSSAVAVERDKDFDEPVKLVRLDLIHQTDTPLADLPAYLGQLALSPSGNKVAYFVDGETLEIRSLDHPQTAVTVHCAYGTFAWGPDENRILLKRGSEKTSNDLVWVSIPDGNLTPILHDLIFGSFALSPDGRTIAVAEPGSNHVEVYPLQ